MIINFNWHNKSVPFVTPCLSLSQLLWKMSIFSFICQIASEDLTPHAGCVNDLNLSIGIRVRRGGGLIKLF